MLFYVFTILTLLATSVHASFHMMYPKPRGTFQASQETQFCGGYTNVNASNRVPFPLSNGFFTIHTPQAGWKVGVLLSTQQNPTSFDNFSANSVPQLIHPYASQASAGRFCIPLDIAAAKVPGAVDGANVTIQFVFNAGSGNLYQCADLTLSSNFTAPNATCSNVTETASAATPSKTSAGSLGKAVPLTGFAAVALSVFGMALAAI